jgi:hypothetical protein
MTAVQRDQAALTQNRKEEYKIRETNVILLKANPRNCPSRILAVARRSSRIQCPPLAMLTSSPLLTVPSQDDLEDNFAKLSHPQDPTSPIESVFKAASVRQFAAAGGDPVSDTCHCPRKVLKTFEKSGVFYFPHPRIAPQAHG